MNFYSLSLLLACAAFAQAQAPDQTQPVINTPMAVVQCLPTQLTFSGGSPPYILTAIPAGQVGAAPLADLGPQTGNSYTWNVTLPAGTSVTLQIRDSKGVINFSQSFTVQPGGDTSCMTSASGGSTTNSPNPTSPTSANPPVSTGTVTPPVPSNSTSSPRTNSSSSPRPNSPPLTTGLNSSTNAVVPSTSNTNQTKGPSVFTPPTSSTSNITSSNAAPTSASNSAASGIPFQLKDLLWGTAVAGVVLTVFA